MRVRGFMWSYNGGSKTFTGVERVRHWIQLDFWNENERYLIAHRKEE